MADRLNIIIEQGATFPLYITWKDSDGDPINLTGYRIRMQVRQAPTATTTLLSFDSDAPGSGMTIAALDATGVIDIKFAPSVTAALVFTNAEWDITATSPGGIVDRLAQGKASVSLGVTR